MVSNITSIPEFFTATNLEWKQLLIKDDYKEIIISSLKFLVDHGRVNIFAFVIMPNHIHLIWQMLNGLKRADVQRDFLKYTAQQIKFKLLDNNPEYLKHFRVDSKDRVFQFWERNPLSIGLWSKKVLMQKLQYIHNNPVKAGLCQRTTDYYFSSASFYETGVDQFGFLKHYDGYIFDY